jgi:hypothetical protein
MCTWRGTSSSGRELAVDRVWRCDVFDCPLCPDIVSAMYLHRGVQGFGLFEPTVAAAVDLLIEAAQTAQHTSGNEPSTRRKAARALPLHRQTRGSNLSSKRFKSRFLIRVSSLFERLSTRLLRFDMWRARSDDIMRGWGPERASALPHDAPLLLDGRAPELPMQSKSCAAHAHTRQDGRHAGGRGGEPAAGEPCRKQNDPPACRAHRRGRRIRR